MWGVGSGVSGFQGFRGWGLGFRGISGDDTGNIRVFSRAYVRGYLGYVESDIEIALRSFYATISTLLSVFCQDVSNLLHATS